MIKRLQLPNHISLLKLIQSLFNNSFEMWLFFISLTIAILWGLCNPVHYNGDSEQSLLMAWKILGMENGEYFYYRTDGLPLLFILTGVATLKTFTWLIIVQIITAASIPLLVYRTYFPYNNNIARISSVAIMAFSFPYLYQTNATTDHMAFFLLFLAMFFISRYFVTQSLISIIWATLAFFVMALFRPAAGLIIFAVWLVMLLRKPLPWKQILISIFLFISLSTSDSIIRASFLNPPGKPGYVSSVTVFPLTNMNGKMFLYNVYNSSREFLDNRPVILSEKNGPNSIMFYHDMRNYLNEHKTEMNITDVEAYIQDITIHTDPWKHAVIWSLLDNIYGPAKGDRVIMNVALEALKIHPQILYLYWDSFVQFFLGFDMDYNFYRNPNKPGIFALPSSFYISSSVNQNIYQGSRVSPAMIKQQQYSYIPQITIYSTRNYQYFAKIVSVLFALLFAPLWWHKNLRYLLLLNTIIVIYQAVIVVTVWVSHVRYIETVVPSIMIVAIAGVYYFRDWLLKKPWQIENYDLS